VGVCDTAAAAERSAAPTTVAALACDFMTFTSCFDHLRKARERTSFSPAPPHPLVRPQPHRPRSRQLFSGTQAMREIDRISCRHATEKCDEFPSPGVSHSGPEAGELTLSYSGATPDCASQQI
jgi:hypothetical protein